MGILDQFSLRGRTSLVTGAGQGIGQAYAMALAEAGADVAVIDINPTSAARVSREIAALGVRSMALTVDVRDAEQVNRMVETIDRREQRGHRILGSRRGDDRRAMALGDVGEPGCRVLLLPRRGTRDARPGLWRDREHGLHVRSDRQPAAETDRLQCFQGRSGAPHPLVGRRVGRSWCLGELYQSSLVDQVADLVPGWLADTPMGRMAETSDLQGALVYLASAASDFVTGHDLVVDGGFTLW